MFTADGGASRACVVVNYGDGTIETTVTFDAVSGNAEVCQAAGRRNPRTELSAPPGRPDRISELPATIELPPQSCAVVVARSS